VIWIWVFLASVLEEIIVPIPSTAIIASAAMISKPLDVFLQVVVPSAAGSTIGSIFLYSIGAVSAEAVKRLWGIDAAKYMSKIKTVPSLVALRAVPIIPFSAVSAAAGAARFPIPGYMLASFLGGMVRNSIIAFPVSAGIEAWKVAGLPWQAAAAIVVVMGIAAYMIAKKIMENGSFPL